MSDLRAASGLVGQRIDILFDALQACHNRRKDRGGRVGNGTIINCRRCRRANSWLRVEVLNCWADSEAGDEIYNEAHVRKYEVVDDAFIIAGGGQFDRLLYAFTRAREKNSTFSIARKILTS